MSKGSLGPLPIFVYGTLQRGELRENCWPYPARRIEAATIRATLYDLGPHPAIGPGDNRVLGELWHLAPQHLPATLEVLDAIEGYQQAGEEDWYVREVVDCTTEAGAERQAYAYFYARLSELPRFPVVLPNAAGVCGWTRRR